ncbi:G-protein coupled receptor activity protein [Homalodisca vitripennis]|nr:G-protein coupled receptor activity protein [Homalodisca vitripennis]
MKEDHDQTTVGPQVVAADMDELLDWEEESILLPLELCGSRNQTNHSDWVLEYQNRTVHCLEHAPTLTDGAYTRALVLGGMAVLSLVGNLLTIYSIHTSRHSRRQRHQSAMYSLILHLSVADLLVTVFCLGGEAVWSYTVAWLAGNLACKLFKFLEMFSLYLSTFVLVLIGVDRFLAVRYPIKSLSTAKRCNRLVGCAWGLSALLSVPQHFQSVSGTCSQDLSLNLLNIEYIHMCHSKKLN